MSKQIKRTLVFGRVVIDLLHQFFGEANPSAFVIADIWSSEDEDGEEHDVWCDHYRGHIRFTYADLRDTERFYITDTIVDCTKDVLEQVKEVEERFNKPSTTQPSKPTTQSIKEEVK